MAMDTYTTDVLIIGSGAAGLRAAVAAAQHNVTVTVLSKGDAANCTEWADSNYEITGGGGCGLAAPIHPPDSPESYFEDLSKVAGGRNIPELTEIFAQKATAAVTYLQHRGARFVTGADGYFKVVPEMWHSHPRILYSQQGTGREVRRVLKQEALAAGVTFLDGLQVTKLITKETGVCGCLAFQGTPYKTIGIRSKSTVLATGGAGGLFPQSSNHHKITGDGVFLAVEAGAELINMDLYSDIPISVAPVKGQGFVPHLLLSGKDLGVDKILGSRTFTWQLDPKRLSPESINQLYPETDKKLRAQGFDWNDHVMSG